MAQTDDLALLGNSRAFHKYPLGTDPLSSSWIIIIIWLYIALSRTLNIDCYLGGGSTQNIPLVVGWALQGGLRYETMQTGLPVRILHGLAQILTVNKPSGRDIIKLLVRTLIFLCLLVGSL